MSSISPNCPMTNLPGIYSLRPYCGISPWKCIHLYYSAYLCCRTMSRSRSCYRICLQDDEQKSTLLLDLLAGRLYLLIALHYSIALGSRTMSLVPRMLLLVRSSFAI